MESFFKAVLKEGFQYLGKKLDAVANAVKDNNVDLTKPLQDQTRILSSAISQLEAIATKTQNPLVDVSVDTKSLEKEIQSASSVLKKLEIPTTQGIETLLTSIYDCLEEHKSMMQTSNKALMEAIASIKLNVPSTIKIDDMQVRAISARMPVNPAPIAARTVRTTNIALTSTASQYSYSFPSNTSAFTIKLRDQGSLLYYSWTTGTLPTIGGGGDGSNYMTAPQNFLRSIEGVDYGGKTIYLGSEANSMTAEIEVFSA